MLPPFEFRPEGEEGPVYRFRRPTVGEKNFGFGRAVRARGGIYHSEFELLAVLEKGIAALTDAGPEREKPLAAVAHYRRTLVVALERRRAEERTKETVLPAKAPEELTDAEKEAQRAKAEALLEEAAVIAAAAEAVQEIAEIVRRGYPRFAAMEADRGAYFAIRGLAAVDLFGIDLDPETMPAAHIAAIGVWCQALMAPTDAQRKNSSSPSPASATPASSTSSSPSVH